jgi:cyclophilin family peptidyl-prolyl cis-trans isomerase
MLAGRPPPLRVRGDWMATLPRTDKGEAVPLAPAPAPAPAPAAAAAPPPSDAFLIGCANDDASCDSIMHAPPPPSFAVRVETTQGPFTVRVNSSLAPPMAQRFYALARLQYATGSPFYRVLRTNSSHAFVTQWGYRGSPSVDTAFISLKTSNATSPVLLSNTRGTVAFGTSEVANNGNMPYCSTTMCSLGFSVELFVNLADNSRLDTSDFSPFGVVDEADMAVVDRLFAGYGECADLCAAPGEGASDTFCVPAPGGGWQGTNLTKLLLEGTPYLKRSFGLLDYVTSTRLVAD